MHLIFATSMVPDGEPKSGYEIANAAILGAFARAGCRISIVGFAWEGRKSALPENAVVLGALDPRTQGAGLSEKFRWLATAFASGLTFSSAKMRLVSQREVQSAIEKLGAYDGVIFNSVQFAGAFRHVFDGQPSLYVAHNVEHLSAAQSANAARSPVERFLFRREARLLRQLENDMCSKARFVYTLSQEDRLLLNISDDERSAVLPLVSHGPSGASATRDTVYDATLIGTWSWAPNRIGLDWFLQEVVPHLPEDFAIAIAGDAPPSLQAAYPHVSFVGRVPDAISFVRSGRVVPLISRAGTGVQLKTIETFEQGLPSVATSSALRGISYKPENCILADDPQDFAEALVKSAAGAPRDVDGSAFHAAQRSALDKAVLRGLVKAGFAPQRKAA